ncbi:hypothetical protein EUTSA_v10027611mg [Eutrema salsugineum]|uniref:Uncharacterized protein n=1 Tax=Eutrema salsugineum TaxID=72664 RepID=V4ME02_EUTSA|nr:hypothetical protein EUTSA_v10027611mg [Eutrema salsugineum]
MREQAEETSKAPHETQYQAQNQASNFMQIQNQHTVPFPILRLSSHYNPTPSIHKQHCSQSGEKSCLSTTNMIQQKPELR